MSKESSGKEVNWPIGTLLLFGSCVIVFGLIALGKIPDVLDYVVYFEADMQFLQCLTSLFIHLGNPVQLIVCMVFLLLMGTLVEMRVGPYGTIGLFAALGYVGQMVAQMVLLDANNGGVSLGAGAGISGLAGMLLVWSPTVRVSSLSKMKIAKEQFQFPLWAYVIAWVLLDAVVYTAVVGLGGVSLIPQVISFLTGGIVAVVLLRTKVIEGDHQDLWTLITGTAPGGRKDQKRQALLKQEEEETQQKTVQLLSDAQTQLDQFLSNHQLAGALALLTKMSEVGTKLTVSREQMLAIIKGLHRQNQWEDSIPWLQRYLDQYPDDVAMRLKLAQIFVVQQRLPGSAMEVLKPLEEMSLNEAEEKLLRKIERTADAMWEDDDIQLELQKRDW